MSNAPIQIGLTRAQRKCLEIIKSHIKQFGQAPSYREIATMFGFKSTGRVTELLHALQERGWITFLPNRAHSITVLEKPTPRTGGYQLPLALDAALRRYCTEHGEKPEDVVADAVALFLDEAEGQVAA
ncbi:LexA family protein [Bradyrhizobium japonicum]|uniref:LexA family protein n=1 Tax=Bradyrhizobium japonicum TaxID=375 RepID=UPI001BA75834|nr:hypothetical protein [Bradyrhizobium japonicum]MBR0962215.1 hypothetical protein [Bradyrhizobium japonicum]